MEMIIFYWVLAGIIGSLIVLFDGKGSNEILGIDGTLGFFVNVLVFVISVILGPISLIIAIWNKFN